MLVILGIILFILLVVVHEFGHMIAAKKNGVEVEEFGIGFPPRAKSLGVKNGTEYTLNWLPLGGFVKLKGEHDAATEKGTFGAASFPKKALIIGAGVLMNWLAAIVIFTVISFVGMPQLIDNQFNVSSDATVSKQEVFAGNIEENSPASSIGLAQGDRILQINDIEVNTSHQLRDATSEFAGQDVSVIFLQEDERQTEETTL